MHLRFTENWEKNGGSEGLGRSIGSLQCLPSLGISQNQSAADEGDVETAAGILELMNNSGIAIDVNHVNSAMRACWGWNNKMHRAGKYLFDLLPELGLQPTIISFTSLIGALRTGQLQDILSAYKDMKTQGIEPDQVFAETYLVSVLQLEKSQQVLQARTPQQLQELLRERPVERLKAARQAIADFRKGKMKLSGLCFNIGEALKQLRS